MSVARREHTKWLEYDALDHRLWIAGQRMHHGATGVVVAGTACVGMLTGRTRWLRALVAMAAAGGALMAHDWKDHSLWFQLGRGPQR